MLDLTSTAVKFLSIRAIMKIIVDYRNIYIIRVNIYYIEGKNYLQNACTNALRAHMFVYKYFDLWKFLENKVKH